MSDTFQPFVAALARVRECTARPLSGERGYARGRRPRGMAVLLVLGLLALTLAVSYATLRTQGTAVSTARNVSRSLDARLAAESGMAAAMRKISESTWAGVDVPLSSNVSDDCWYEVSFETGDKSLALGDPNYGEYPYRLTITATGYAADPADPDIRSIHKVRSVVQLARKRLVDDPSGWSTLLGQTVYQWANRNTVVQGPVRVAGASTINGKLYLFSEYPSYSPARNQYLTHLNSMRLANRGDHRPFNGPLAIAYTRQDAATLSDLQVKLALTTLDSSLVPTSAPYSHPGAIASYQLYPGGKTYQPPVLQTAYGSTLQNRTLGPDPLENPLGIFRSSGSLTLQNNVQITGTIVTDGASPEIALQGTGIVLQAPALPPLEGSSQSRRLPTALVASSLRVHSGANAQLKGTALVWDEFEIKNGNASTQLALTGNIFAAGMNLRGRENWIMTSANWQSDYENYNGTGGLLPWLLGSLLNTIRSSLGLSAGDTVYFPEYMQHVRGFTIQPILTLQPDSSGVQTHWHDWTKPVFAKDPADPGLRWNLIRYEDGV